MIDFAGGYKGNQSLNLNMMLTIWNHLPLSVLVMLPSFAIPSSKVPVDCSFLLVGEN